MKSASSLHTLSHQFHFDLWNVTHQYIINCFSSCNIGRDMSWAHASVCYNCAITSWQLLPFAIFHIKNVANLYLFGSENNSHVWVLLLVLLELTGKCTLQVPVAPLHIPTEFSPVFNNSWINESDESTNNHPQEKGIPTLISWSQGGNEVFVEGSWDNWTSRYMLFNNEISCSDCFHISEIRC